MPTARSDAVRVVRAGAACHRASVYARRVLPAAGRASQLLVRGWHMRCPSRAVVSTWPERFELASFSSGWSWVLGIDAIGGPPHCDVADEGGVWVASRWCPNWRAVTLAGVVFDLGGEVGDQLGSLGQVGPPDGMGMERFWYAGSEGSGPGLLGASFGRRQ